MTCKLCLYSVALLAVILLLACLITYATDTTRMMHTPQQEHTVKTRETVKKKNCACCDDKQKRRQEMLRHWLNENAQKEP